MSEIKKKMQSIMQPIEQQVLMCDSQDDLLLLACAMLERSCFILDAIMGIEGRRHMLQQAMEIKKDD